jgi:hypothetical protein
LAWQSFRRGPPEEQNVKAQRSQLLAAMLTSVLAVGAAAGDVATGELGKALAEASGFPGGLAVHVGCGDGALTAALGSGGKFLVQGLALDRASMAAARRTVTSAGLYGRVSVDHVSIAHLPYADGLVNVIVIDDLPACRKAGLSFAEVVRVLGPEGAALVRGPSGEGGAVLRQELVRSGL